MTVTKISGIQPKILHRKISGNYITYDSCMIRISSVYRHTWSIYHWYVIIGDPYISDISSQAVHVSAIYHDMWSGYHRYMDHTWSIYHRYTIVCDPHIVGYMIIYNWAWIAYEPYTIILVFFYHFSIPIRWWQNRRTSTRTYCRSLSMLPVAMSCFAKAELRSWRGIAQGTSRNSTAWRYRESRAEKRATCGATRHLLTSGPFDGENRPSTVV